MQLQYVLANPAQKNAKKTRKRKNKVLKKRNPSKIKHVGGHSVAKKKHGRFKKGSRAAKAYMASIRPNPKRRRKAKKNASGYRLMPKAPRAPAIPKGFKKQKFNYPNEEVVFHKEGIAKMQEDILNSNLSEAKKMSAIELLLDKGLVGRAKKEMHIVKRAQSAAAKAKAARQRGIERNKEAEAAGGKVIITKGNPVAKKRKSKKKGHRSAAQKQATAKLVALNKKRKHKGSKKAHKRKKHAAKKKSHHRARRHSANSAHVFKAAKTFKFKRAKRKLRVKMVGIVNPLNADALKVYAVHAAWAAGGFAAAAGLIKVADSLMGGKITSNINSMAGSYASLVSPLLTAALGAGMVVGSKKLHGKSGEIVAKLGQGAVVAGGIYAATVIVGLLAAQAKPMLAQLPVVGPYLNTALSGVVFTPMGGADFGGPDFGMYPQMGYQQRPGDWGNQTVGGIPAGMNGIPYGMKGIPAGMSGVKYFPTTGMGEVQFYPPGSNGDDMYGESRRAQEHEAEGLGSQAQSLDGADFGDGSIG